MARVIYSAASLDQIERELQSLRATDPASAVAAASALRSAAAHLAAHPLVGTRREGELRELAISYGPTGYLALYRFAVARDEVRMLAFRRQQLLGFLP